MPIPQKYARRAGRSLLLDQIFHSDPVGIGTNITGTHAYQTVYTFELSPADLQRGGTISYVQMSLDADWDLAGTSGATWLAFFKNGVQDSDDVVIEETANMNYVHTFMVDNIAAPITMTVRIKCETEHTDAAVCNCRDVLVTVGRRMVAL